MIGTAWATGMLAKWGLEKFGAWIPRIILGLAIAGLGSWAVIWHEGKKDSLTDPLAAEIKRLDGELVAKQELLSLSQDETSSAREEAAKARELRLTDQNNYVRALQISAQLSNQAFDKQRKKRDAQERKKVQAERQARFEAERQAEVLRINLASTQAAIEGHSCVVPGSLGRLYNAIRDANADAPADRIHPAGMPGPGDSFGSGQQLDGPASFAPSISGDRQSSGSVGAHSH